MCVLDTVYTERYMGLPTSEDNYKGYEVTQLKNSETFALNIFAKLTKKYRPSSLLKLAYFLIN